MTTNRTSFQRLCLSVGILSVVLAPVSYLSTTVACAQSLTHKVAISKVQPKMVKVYGAGGLRGLESYQSGFMISSSGHIATVWSYVLDTENISVVCDDGQRYKAEFLGRDPTTEVAILKIPAQDLPYFNLDDSVELMTGSRVLAFSNLFGIATGNEAASVLHGSVAATTQLSAGKNNYKTLYQGKVYVVDAMTNNPGAAGGVLTDRSGNLAGLLGKELRDSRNGIWLNYAIPISAMASSIDDILAGNFIPRPKTDSRALPREPMTLELLGLILVPDVVKNTPPYIDRIRANSSASEIGLQRNDLILFVNDQIVPSCKAVFRELQTIDRDSEVKITVQRENELVIKKLWAQD